MNFRQAELDLFEKQLLTDIFGGIEPDKMVIGKGLFKLDVSGKVQEYIDMLEEAILPFMDEQGSIKGGEIKSRVSGWLSEVIPNQNFKLMDVYVHISPIVQNIARVIK
jgi:hypothetical protein